MALNSEQKCKNVSHVTSVDIKSKKVTTMSQLFNLHLQVNNNK